MRELRLPSPPKTYEQRDEAETRRLIELALLRDTPGAASGAARRTVTFATAVLAAGASELRYADFGAPGQHLLMLQADKACRIRLYSAAAIRDSDAPRPASTAPDSGVGILLDAIWATPHVKFIAPPVFLYNADAAVASNIYYVVTNTGSVSAAITITATVVSAEVGALGLNPADDSTIDGEVVNLAGAANGQFLKRVGGIWVPAYIAASDVTSGVFAAGRLATGTPNGTLFLRDDQVWSAVPDTTINGETVNLAGAANGQFLKRVSGIWVPANVAAADITSGTIATARLGTGTADGTTFLRGDQTWAVPAGGGGGGLANTDPTFGADAKPVTPNTMDDEFEGATLNAKWNQRNSPTLAYYAAQSRIAIAAPQNAGDNWRFIMQTAPAAQSWRFRAKMTLVGLGANYRSVGLVVSAATTSDKFIYAGLQFASNPKIQASRYTNWTTWNSDQGLSVTDGREMGSYQSGHIMEIEYDSSVTTLYFRWASPENGVVFRQLHSETLSAHLGSIAEIGIGVNTNDMSNGTTYAVVDWFRRMA